MNRDAPRTVMTTWRKTAAWLARVSIAIAILAIPAFAQLKPGGRMVIPVGTDDKWPTPVEAYLGSSRGRWEGNTLVIESSNFTDKTALGGVRHSEQLKLTERLTRIDPEMIEYRITVDDPVTYTAPFTLRTVWTTQPGYEVFEYSCHEGNYAMRNILSGARAVERQAR